MEKTKTKTKEQDFIITVKLGIHDPDLAKRLLRFKNGQYSITLKEGTYADFDIVITGEAKDRDSTICTSTSYIIGVPQ